MHATTPIVCFLDETGLVAQDRYFAVGVLTVPEASDLQVAVQKLRQRSHWRSEWHFGDLKNAGLPIHEALIPTLASSDEWQFHLCISDRDDLGSATCGNRFHLYERIAAQCLANAVPPAAQGIVIADEYTTPDHVRFERQVRLVVNRVADRQAIAGVVRVRSQAHDLLQVADVLTGSIVYPLRHEGTANRPSPKSRFSRLLTDALGSRVDAIAFDPRWLKY